MNAGPWPEAQRNRANALSSVVQTPQSIGMPTAVQARTAVASIAPRPMPNDPAGIDVTPDDLACNAATSLSVMNQWSASGFTIWFAMKPNTSMAARMYIVRS